MGFGYNSFRLYQIIPGHIIRSLLIIFVFRTSYIIFAHQWQVNVSGTSHLITKLHPYLTRPLNLLQNHHMSSSRCPGLRETIICIGWSSVFWARANLGSFDCQSIRSLQGWSSNCTQKNALVIYSLGLVIYYHENSGAKLIMCLDRSLF